MVTRARRTATFYLGAAVLVALSCGKKAPPPKPAVPIAASRAAYVTDNGSDAISVLDRDGTAVVDVSLDVDPDAHEAPHHLAVVSRDARLFVALAFPPEGQGSGKHAGHGRATQAGALLTLDLGTLAVRETRETAENPGDVVATHDGARVLVTHFDMARAMREAAKGSVPAKLSAELRVYDAGTGALWASRPVCVAPHGVTTTRDDSLAVIACYGSDELAFVDLRSSDLPTTRVPVGGSPGVLGAPRYGPYGVALSPDDSLALIADLEGSDVRVMDVHKRALVAESTLAMTGRAMLPAFVGPRVALVPTQAPDALVRVNVGENSVEKRVVYTREECLSPHVARVARDGRAYVVCEGDHLGKGAVLEVDPITLATKHRWTVGVYPDGLAFGDD